VDIQLTKSRLEAIEFNNVLVFDQIRYEVKTALKLVTKTSRVDSDSALLHTKINGSSLFHPRHRLHQKASQNAEQRQHFQNRFDQVQHNTSSPRGVEHNWNASLIGKSIAKHEQLILQKLRELAKATTIVVSPRESPEGHIDSQQGDRDLLKINDSIPNGKLDSSRRSDFDEQASRDGKQAATPAQSNSSEQNRSVGRKTRVYHLPGRWAHDQSPELTEDM